MAEFHRASRRRVNAFAVEERSLFKHYFERDEGAVADAVREGAVRLTETDVQNPL